MQVLIDWSSDTKNHAGFVPNNDARDVLWKIAISQISQGIDRSWREI